MPSLALGLSNWALLSNSLLLDEMGVRTWSLSYETTIFLRVYLTVNFA